MSNMCRNESYIDRKCHVLYWENNSLQDSHDKVPYDSPITESCIMSNTHRNDSYIERKCHVLYWERFYEGVT